MANQTINVAIQKKEINVVINNGGDGGGGGNDTRYKGYYETLSDLQTTIPTGENSWFAIVGSEQRIYGWITSSWALLSPSSSGSGVAKYNKASWQTFTQSLPGFTTAAAYANALLGYYITVLENTTISQIQARLSSGSAGSAVFGVYSLNSVGYPSTKLFQTSVIDTSLTSPQLTIGTQVIPAGNYFVAMNCTTASCSFVALTAASIYNQFAGVGSVIVTSGYFSGYYIANTYNNIMPTTFPAGAGPVGLANVPFIIFKTAT